MTPILLSPTDLASASLLLIADAGLAAWLGLGLARPMLVSAARMVVQLVAIGFVLRFVFAAGSPALTAALLLAMTLIAAREAASRAEPALEGGFAIAVASIAGPALLAGLLALTTALRPTPWWSARYAVPLVGIILGTGLNAASLALESVTAGVRLRRAAIEARLALGARFSDATASLRREAIRRGILPVLNQMAAAGIVTLPGTMTGQILAGMPPMQAVTYQILLMLLLGGAGFLCAGMAAMLALHRLRDGRHRLRLDRLAAGVVRSGMTSS